eukprot:scaffold3313_cov95-Skeletonema_dohrnii-CCMP3373.AAC.1
MYVTTLTKEGERLHNIFFTDLYQPPPQKNSRKPRCCVTSGRCVGDFCSAASRRHFWTEQTGCRPHIRHMTLPAEVSDDPPQAAAAAANGASSDNDSSSAPASRILR